MNISSINNQNFKIAKNNSNFQFRGFIKSFFDKKKALKEPIKNDVVQITTPIRPSTPHSVSFYMERLEQNYHDIRCANYSYQESISPNLAPDTFEPFVKNEMGTFMELNGWNWRVPKGNKLVTDAKDRVSLNVRADQELLNKLDVLLSKHFYRDENGRLKKVKMPIGAYKIPLNEEQWLKRQDPITLYFEDDLPEKAYEALIEITEPYMRQPYNGMKLLNADDSTPWISREKYTTSEQLEALHKKAQYIDKNLAYAIESYAYDRSMKMWHASAGQYEAIKRTMKDAYIYRV